MENKSIKAYKVFNSDWTCRGFKFEVGKTYNTGKPPVLCKSGFHACIKAADCFNYYNFDSNNKVAEVEFTGMVVGIDDGGKIAGDKITIVKEISWIDVLNLVNIGRNNTGYRNTGDRNTGDSNAGNRNTGYRNTGNRITGNRNTGNWNSTSYETGFFNTIQSEFINIFNKPCKRSDWNNSIKPNFLYFNLTEFISENKMTDSEKELNPDYKISGGYLKEYSYKEAFKKSWDNATKEDKDLLEKLPNFDWKVFTEISGIEKP
jgi:hypothetical protein